MPAQQPARPASNKGEIVKPGPSTLAKPTEVPEYLRGTAGQGLEEMGREDILLPRIAVAQTLSRALNKKKPEFIEGLQSGDLYNTVTREIYGRKLHFVPVLFTKARILFEDINKGGGILCQSLNGINGGRLCPQGCAGCEKAAFIDGEAPECNLFMNYPGLVLNQKSKDEYEIRGMAAASMKSTALKVAKQWNSLMRLGNLASFARVYEIGSVDDQKDGNDFWNFTVKPLGFTPKELFDAATEFYKQLKSSTIRVDASDDEDPTAFNAQDM